MTQNQERLVKRLEKYSKFGKDFYISISTSDIKEILKLINKPVETTNEQPKIPLDLRIEIMKIMGQHVDLRNSAALTDRDLYHKFLDWEKEMWKIIIG